MAVAAAVATISQDEHRRQLRRALVASTVGTTIEWYDFLLYGTVSALVFGPLFFPQSDPLMGVLQSFGIFFVGFVGRPIGAAIFGHWGDRIGRKATLIATLLLTGIATTLVGLVPTYDSIGMWGAVLLTLLRLIQGIGVAANGAARSCWRWNGREQTKIAVCCRRGHSSARLVDCFWRMLRCLASVSCQAISLTSGAGAFRS
jgi:hypothetical protein